VLFCGFGFAQKLVISHACIWYAFLVCILYATLNLDACNRCSFETKKFLLLLIFCFESSADLLQESSLLRHQLVNLLLLLLYELRFFFFFSCFVERHSDRHLY
jgi:hypothetical protein